MISDSLKAVSHLVAWYKIFIIYRWMLEEEQISKCIYLWKEVVTIHRTIGNNWNDESTGDWSFSIPSMYFCKLFFGENI